MINYFQSAYACKKIYSRRVKYTMEDQANPFDFPGNSFPNQSELSPYPEFTCRYPGEHAPMNQPMALSLPPTQLVVLDMSTQLGIEQLNETPPPTPNPGNASAQSNEKVRCYFL